MSRLASLADAIKVASGHDDWAQFDDAMDFDEYGGHDTGTGSTVDAEGCEALLKRLLADKSEKGPGASLKAFRTSLTPIRTLLLTMSQGSDHGHLKAIGRIYTAFLSKGNALAQTLNDQRTEMRSPDTLSEAFLSAVYLTVKLMREIGVQDGGQAPLDDDAEAAAVEAVQELNTLQMYAKKSWGILHLQRLQRANSAKSIGGCLAPGLRSVQTFKRVTSRGEIAQSLPVLGVHMLYAPVLPILMHSAAEE